MSTTQPKKVKLTEDFLDLKAGVGFEVGTVLLRQSSGQYAPEGGKLGQPCVTMFSLIEDICEPVE
jgi:hypothetical protein